VDVERSAQQAERSTSEAVATGPASPLGAGATEAEHLLALQRSAGNRALGHWLARSPRPCAPQPTTATRRALQRSKKKKHEVSYKLTIYEEISGEEFFIRAVMRIYGIGRDAAMKRIADGKVTCSHFACATGISGELVGQPQVVTIDGGGGGLRDSGDAAAERRRSAAFAHASKTERASVHSEADRRFWERMGLAPGTKLGTGAKDAGLREEWFRSRDSVLRDEEAIRALPARVRQIVTAGGGRLIRPDEYTTVLRIAGKLQGFSEEEWLLYGRRATIAGDDYDALERTIDAFLAEQAGTKQTIAGLSGKEDLLEQIRAFEDLQREMFTPPLKSDRLPIDQPGNWARYEKAEADLDAALEAAGFDSLGAFYAATEAFLNLFRARAGELTMLALRESERAVLAERARYEKPTENEALFKEMAAFRAATTASWEAARESMPTAAQLKTESFEMTPYQKAALKRSMEETAKADAERERLRKSHPILADTALRSEAMNTEDAASLGAVLRGNARDRLSDIRKTRSKLASDPDVVYRFDRVVELTLNELGVGTTSVFADLVKERKERIEGREMAIGFMLAALGIGLGLLTFGGGTLAIAAGAGGLVISGVGLATEWEKYDAARAAAHTDFNRALTVSSEEPSAIWVALALVGFGLEGAALANAFRAVLPAAKVLEATGDVAKFEAQLAKASELSQGLQDSLAKAARAQKEYRAAAEEFSRALRATFHTAHMGIPEDVVVKATKAAYHAAKRGVREFEVFLAELRRQKFAQGIDFDALDADAVEALARAFRVGSDEYAADAARIFGVDVPYGATTRRLTFDEAGGMVLDGKPVGATKRDEIYKQLDLTHAHTGHGPAIDARVIANQANAPGKASGKFATDEAMIRAVADARARVAAGEGAALANGDTLIHIPATPNTGRAFSHRTAVPEGLEPLNAAPFEGLEDVVELTVTHVRAILRADGSVRSIFPVGSVLMR
jgi:hypothetical protein